MRGLSLAGSLMPNRLVGASVRKLQHRSVTDKELLILLGLIFKMIQRLLQSQLRGCLNLGQG